MFEHIHLLIDLIICTTINHVSLREPAKPITLPISLSSLFETPHSSLLKLQPQSSLPLLSIFCKISLSSYISVFSYNHSSLLIFCFATYISPSCRTSPSIKSATCNSRSFFTCCTTHN